MIRNNNTAASTYLCTFSNVNGIQLPVPAPISVYVPGMGNAPYAASISIPVGTELGISTWDIVISGPTGSQARSSSAEGLIFIGESESYFLDAKVRLRSSGDEWATSASVAAGGLSSDPHIAELRILSGEGQQPVRITMSGGDGFSTGSYWWWEGERRVDATLTIGGQTVTTTTGEPIDMIIGSGQHIGALVSSNAVGVVHLSVVCGELSREIDINMQPGEFVVDLSEGQPYTWREAIATLKFRDFPLVGHHCVIFASEVLQGDGTRPTAIIRADAATSRYLDQYVWIGEAWGKLYHDQTASDGTIATPFQVFGNLPEVTITGVDYSVAKGLQ